MRLLWVDLITQGLNVRTCAVCQLRHIMAYSEGPAGFVEMWMFRNAIVKHDQLIREVSKWN